MLEVIDSALVGFIKRRPFSFDFFMSSDKSLPDPSQIIKIGHLEWRNPDLSTSEKVDYFMRICEWATHRHECLIARRKNSRYAAPPVPATRRLLSVEAKDYMNNSKRFRSKSTKDAFDLAIRHLMRVCGDIPVCDITLAHIVDSYELVQWAPDRYTNTPKLAKSSAQELIKLGRESRVEPVSASKLEAHCAALEQFFKVLTDTEALNVSPMAGFHAPKVRAIRSSSQRDPFWSIEELQAIFEESAFVSWAKKYPHRWWIPILALYTGARVSELAQLKANDVIFNQDRWCLSLRPTADEDLVAGQNTQSRQTIKNESSIRIVPIAKPVLDAGFLDFVQDIKKRQFARLFPNLSAGTHQKTGESFNQYSRVFIHQFRTYLNDRGIQGRVGVHAFRHYLSSELAEQQVPDLDICLITGHASDHSSNSRTYTHRKEATVRKMQWEALARFKPPVTLPGYQRGQFAKALGKDAKHYA